MAKNVTIQHYFPNVSMQNQHDGLVAHAKKQKLDLLGLPPGQIATFTNTAFDKVKVYASIRAGQEGVLSYKRATKGEQLNPLLIGEIVNCLGADGKVNWAQAERAAFDKQWKKHERKRSSMRAPTPKEIARVKSGGQREASL